MDLGIAGRRAAVAAASKGLGLRRRAGARRRRCAGRDLRPPRRHDRGGGRRDSGAGAVPIVADLVDSRRRGRLRRATRAPRSAGSTSSSPTRADRRPATSRASPSTSTSMRSSSTAARRSRCVTRPCPRCASSGGAAWSRSRRSRCASRSRRLILSNTARAGVTGFLKTLAREIAADGVTVNSLLPGLHATERIAALHSGGGDPDRRASPRA